MRQFDKFEFKITKGFDKPVICFRLHNEDVIIFPKSLYEILWDCWREHDFSIGVKAKFLILREEVCGHFFCDSYGSFDVDYDRRLFIESAISALTDLCNYTILNGETAYKNFWKETAEQMLLGLKDLIIPNCYAQISEEEIQLEKFSFGFNEPYSCDTAFSLKIGDREYVSYISDWSTSFNKIRMEMENYALSYLGESEININFEDSPTIIRLGNHELSTKQLVTKVTIIPNEFAKVPITFGWCDSRQLLKSLYLGMLGLCIPESNWFEDTWNDKDGWEKFRLSTYNKLQSSVIENIIKGIREDNFTFMPRQRIVQNVDEMLDDYSKLLKELS